jgi:transmembrane sensor
MEKKLFTAEEFAADESFIAYYLKSDPAAVAHWEKWIALNPEKIDEVQIAENLLDLLYTRLPQHEFESERERLTAFIRTNHLAPSPAKATQVKRVISLRSLIRIAAVITLISSAALFFSKQISQNAQEAKQLVAWTTYTSPRAQQSTVRLSDGTQVILNAGSSLSYPKAFSGKERLVTLTGQAFFEVSHDTRHPFIVRTGKVKTRVLGTAFNVSNFKGDQTIAVALIRGSVQIEVKDSKEIMRLSPGEMMSYELASGKVHKSTFDETVEAGWTKGILVFKNAGFAGIAKAFKQNYGYTLINQSRLTALTYTGQFKQQTPAQIIKAICFSLNLNYTLQDSTIVLSNP